MSTEVSEYNLPEKILEAGFLIHHRLERAIQKHVKFVCVPANGKRARYISVIEGLFGITTAGRIIERMALTGTLRLEQDGRTVPRCSEIVRTVEKLSRKECGGAYVFRSDTMLMVGMMLSLFLKNGYRVVINVPRGIPGNRPSLTSFTQMTHASLQ